jgi:transposase InsO family protein
MNLALSTYYYKPKRDLNIKRKSDTDIRAKIEEIHLTFPGYGWRRIQREFLKKGLRVNHKRIKRIMREFGLYSVLRRQFKIRTTDSNHPFKVYKNLLLGKKVTGINQVWAVDITYIRLEVEFIYLAAIIDIYSRKIVGWAISRHINHQLCLKALQVALRLRKPKPGCIHHSDRGVQYCSEAYVKCLKEAGLKISMCSVGSPKENAFIESFFKTLKHEEILLNEYQTYEKVLERVPKFIEDVYNKKRMHSSLEYESPNEFERKLKRMKRSARPVQKLVDYFL